VPVISQLSTMCPFSQWILIFANCILINILNRPFATYSAIDAYLMTIFYSQFCISKKTISIIAKCYMINDSTTALLTCAVKSDASVVISEAWFCVAALFPIF